MRLASGMGAARRFRDTMDKVRVVRAPIPNVYATLSRSSHHFGKHWHDVFGFGVVERGAQSSASGRGQVSAYAGNVITTNPGEVHDGRPLGATSRTWKIVSVGVEMMASLVDLPAGKFEISRPVIDDPELSSMIERLFRIIESDATDVRPVNALACEEALTEACTVLLSRYGNRSIRELSARDDLARVRERLSDLHSPAPSLGELAHMTGLSRFQIMRQFVKQYGMSPHAWLLHYRAESARGLIRRGHSLALAAAAAGFADQSHMTRVFVRHFGYTPGVWQHAVTQ